MRGFWEWVYEKSWWKDDWRMRKKQQCKIQRMIYEDNLEEGKQIRKKDKIWDEWELKG